MPPFYKNISKGIVVVNDLRLTIRRNELVDMGLYGYDVSVLMQSQDLKYAVRTRQLQPATPLRFIPPPVESKEEISTGSSIRSDVTLVSDTKEEVEKVPPKSKSTMLKQKTPEKVPEVTGEVTISKRETGSIAITKKEPEPEPKPEPELTKEEKLEQAVNELESSITIKKRKKCKSHTAKGSPCQKWAVTSSEYCAMHKPKK